MAINAITTNAVTTQNAKKIEQNEKQDEILMTSTDDNSSSVVTDEEISDVLKNNETFIDENKKVEDTDNNSTNNEKVSFKEGLSLIGKGFANKLKDMATSIVEHPLKTAATALGTTAVIAAAPIVGISSATVGAALAIGFGAYAVGKTVADTVETVKDHSNGNYDEVREDLENIGGDGVDLALSLPFMPKAINQVSRTIKYGTESIGFNTELVSNLTKAKSFSDVSLEFAKANTSINYDMITNEMGLEVKPELKFKKTQSQGGLSAAAEFKPASGEINVSENFLKMDPINKTYQQINGVTPETALRHELEHFEQFSDIARLKGSDGLKTILEDSSNTNIDDFNSSFYDRIINKEGSIQAGTSEAEIANNYITGINERSDMLNNLSGISNQAEKIAAYENSTLEKPAYEAQRNYYNNNVKIRPNTLTNLVQNLTGDTYLDSRIEKLIEDETVPGRMITKDENFIEALKNSIATTSTSDVLAATRHIFDTIKEFSNQ